MSPFVALTSFTMAVDKVQDVIASTLAPISQVASNLVKNASGQDLLDLLYAIGIDLSRAIQDGPGRGQKTWEWMGGPTVAASKSYKAGLTSPWQRQMVRAALLKLFGDKSADDAYAEALATKAKEGAVAPPDTSSGGGAAGLVALLGAGLLAVNALSGVRNPARRRRRRRAA